MKNFHTLLYLAGAMVTSIAAHAATPLDLESYLNQVKSTNESLRANALTTEASAEKLVETEMIYLPTAFATIQAAQDKKELSPISQRGSQTDYRQYMGGISKLTEWGTAAKLYYSTSRTSIKDTEERFVPEPAWYDGATVLEVTHPLWKNANGQDLKTSAQLQRTQSTLTALSESLKGKLTLTEAEASYWRLVISRESLKTAAENFERANRIVAWNRKRVQSELADSADLIQAQSLSDIREIELTMATNEERSAAHAFNTNRGNSSNAVPEELTKITPQLLEQIPTPTRTGDREDVQIATSATSIADLAMALSSSKYEPSLDVFANFTLNGRDPDARTKAMSEAMSTKYPSWVVGLKLSAPLGGETKSRLRGGWAKEKEASTLLAQRKTFEVDREWTDLMQKLEESKGRLQLVQRVESTQKRKLDAERDRQKRGRSTMFQVMQFESDFAQSQLNVIRNKAEILGVIARMKTFGGAR